jgi:hypothetical protein
MIHLVFVHCSFKVRVVCVRPTVLCLEMLDHALEAHVNSSIIIGAS